MRRAAYEEGNIILLNGVSSAGKTTLSRAIQNAMDQHYYLMGNDLFFDMLPERFAQEDWMEAEYQALSMMGHTARLFSDHGKHVIIDAVLLSIQKNDPYGQLREIWAGYPIYSVNVTCPAGELAHRERERGDRDIGQAESQLPLLYPQTGYDLVVDTHASSPQECAARIRELVLAGAPCEM